MNVKQFFNSIVIALLILNSCTNRELKQSAPENSLLSRLKQIKGKGILFGHQDDLAYGMQWSDIEGESDVKRLTGDYPAIFGWELGGIELDHKTNLDSVTFETIQRMSIWGHKKGGVNTFSWHPFSAIDSVDAWHGDSSVVKHILPGGSHHIVFNNHLAKLAIFLKTLKDEKGQDIPFIFRPWHEMDGGWFWWGAKACTPEEFKALFRYTINYLRVEKGLTQMLVAYSPDRNFRSQEEYLTWYPGDDIIDIVGLDNYWDFKQENGEIEVIKKLHIVIKTALQKQKLAAFTETGYENVTDSIWFTQKLGAVLSDSIIKNELSYVMVWRNDPKVHFYFPYPGHPAASDAVKMLKQEHVFLLEDFKK